jgi:protein gp37
MSGCTPCSEACRACYAKSFATRFAGSNAFPKGFEVTLHENRMLQPFHWKKPRRIFVCPTGDLFHDEVPDEFIDRVFSVMVRCPQHTFQLLTKRAERMRDYFRDIAENRNGAPQRFLKLCDTTTMGAVIDMRLGRPVPNIWAGVTAENQPRAEERITMLLQTLVAVRYVSVEPMLGSVDLRNLRAHNGALIDALCGDVKTPDGKEIYAACPGKVDWTICGCESGSGRRPMNPDWARSLRDQCVDAHSPYFLKQMEVGGKLMEMPKLDGVTWAQFPG